MNPQLIIDIAKFALSLVEAQVTGTVQQGATVADTLVKILQKGAQAYRQQTGKALDLSLIQAEEPI